MLSGENTTILNCFSTGNISGTDAGGIIGSTIGYNSNANSSINITNCYSIGSIANGCGGIVGGGSGTPSPQTGTITISNCYSNGTIGVTNAGGIASPTLGTQHNIPLTVINSYWNGTNDLAGAGIAPGKGTITNCYGYNGAWSDTTANTSLMGTGGTTWTSPLANNPYLLSSYNAALYSPNTATYTGPPTYTTANSIILGTLYRVLSVTSSGSATVNPAGGALTFTDLSSNTVYTANVLSYLLSSGNYYGYNMNNFTLTTTNIISNVCFPAGTPVVTDQGVIAIDKIDSSKHTIRGMTIVGITQTVTRDKYLVQIEKDALSENVPLQKTRISANHHVFYKGKMRRAKELLQYNLEGVYKVKYHGEVLYNVLLDTYEKMVVNNMICDTLHPEHGTAKLFKALQAMTPEEQIQTIQKYNAYVLANDLFNDDKQTTSSLKH